ncbi:MAG TPA: ubiquinol-cytochrome c reductase iron-sulfur subunit [candidate division Zixibacteria bacterium]|nr:ubiquinol-cytochrome c reductase iron-sulfur subunit [candidate division Zixibacteria bacterium]
MQGDKTDRRSFLNYILGGSLLATLAAVFYPVLAYLKPPEVSEAMTSSIKVGNLEDFPPDSSKIFKFGRKPGILIHTPDGEFKAFNATCTHLSCVVQYRKDLGVIWCACHNGRFNLNGKNISGPPPRPLERFDVHIKGEEIYVSRRET